MTKVCVPGGQVPSGHLFEPLTRGYIVSEIDLPDLNPPRRAQPESNPTLSASYGRDCRKMKAAIPGRA